MSYFVCRHSSSKQIISMSYGRILIVLDAEHFYLLSFKHIPYFLMINEMKQPFFYRSWSCMLCKIREKKTFLKSPVIVSIHCKINKIWFCPTLGRSPCIQTHYMSYIIYTHICLHFESGFWQPTRSSSSTVYTEYT